MNTSSKPATERKKVSKSNRPSAKNLTTMSVQCAEVEIYRQKPSLLDFSVQPEKSLNRGSSHSVNQKATHDHLEPMLKALISIKE